MIKSWCQPAVCRCVRTFTTSLRRETAAVRHLSLTQQQKVWRLNFTCYSCISRFLEFKLSFSFSVWRVSEAQRHQMLPDEIVFLTHLNTRKQRQNQSFLWGNCGCSSFHGWDHKPVTWTCNCTHSRVYSWERNYKINCEIKEIWLQTDFYTVYKMVTNLLFRQMFIWSKHQLVKGVLIFLIRRKKHLYPDIFTGFLNETTPSAAQS